MIHKMTVIFQQQLYNYPDHLLSKAYLPSSSLHILFLLPLFSSLPPYFSFSLTLFPTQPLPHWWTFVQCKILKVFQKHVFCTHNWSCWAYGSYCVMKLFRVCHHTEALILNLCCYFDISFFTYLISNPTSLPLSFPVNFLPWHRRHLPQRKSALPHNSHLMFASMVVPTWGFAIL